MFCSILYAPLPSYAISCMQLVLGLWSKATGIIRQIENELNKFIALSNAQDEEKQAFDAENKDVFDMLPAIDDLIRDIYDEVEFYYRKETAANRRKMARQWGILYVSQNGELASREEED